MQPKPSVRQKTNNKQTWNACVSLEQYVLVNYTCSGVVDWTEEICDDKIMCFLNYYYFF